ncbi:MAG TPA: hypothetical protein VFE82_05590 [Ramlibacter sp.]|jgi:hypothetical protein|uniref:hypothetical protein n=1 Tax=Ramlibacter sp. TaxID=1917967 RepID=UPI002D3061AB|nr:hypothetical protein [Ramlibacter sp.]HZY17934.1 hypothetical protein [Ramlibacter sp.]
MFFNVGVQHGEHYLLVVGTGAATVSDLCGGASLGAVTARLSGCRRVLIDLLGVEQDLSFTEHLQLGAHLAEVAAGLERVATVVPAQQKVGVSERAAQLQGLQIKTFTSLADAQAWLTQP